MPCQNCGNTVVGGVPTGCGQNGSCLTGGCNKLNTFDWLTGIPPAGAIQPDLFEISFKNGSRKEFCRNVNALLLTTGEMVAVETDSGFDVGRISLSGELVKLQMKKKRERRKRDVKPIIRHASPIDIKKLTEARAEEGAIMLRARKFAGELELDMKIGDVELQADRRKAIFYYTAEDRVDFRELIRRFAREFRLKIEMRQIGSRQEAGKIGGIGSCGRELCCSTWLSNFKTVSTAAARYQNLAINQSKLSGQCGRLKCCLNYELDTYTEVLKEFPKKADKIRLEDGVASLVKTDIFQRIMYYAYEKASKLHPVKLDIVLDILTKNKAGEPGPSILGFYTETESEAKQDKDLEFVETAHVSLNSLEKSARKRKQKNSRSASTRDNRKRGGGANKAGNRKGGENRQARNEGRNPQKSNRPKSNRPPQNRTRDRNKPGAGNNPDRPDSGNRPPRQTSGSRPKRNTPAQKRDQGSRTNPPGKRTGGQQSGRSESKGNKDSKSNS